jgi:methyltransferase (TIGR00027 family)
MEAKIDHVSDTAIWVATYRAEESERPDALFRDPLARRLSGEKGVQISNHLVGSKYTRWNVVMRTCIIDRWIKQELANGVDLVVNLGAGLDTRPYRMQLPPELRWVEADFPHMIDFKERELAGERPHCRLERVRVDLSDDAKRAAFLDDMARSAKKIFVITEGVVPYLTNEQTQALGMDLAARPAFRFWVVDYISPKVTEYLRKGKFRRQMKNAPFRFNPSDWFGFFASFGWKEKEVRYLADESMAQKRAIPMPLFAKLLMPFMPRKKREELRKFTAYVLLEPAARQ